MSGHAATPTTSSRMHARDFSGALGTNTTMGHGIEFQYGTMPAHHKEWIMKETRRLDRRDIKLDHVKSGGNIEDLHTLKPTPLTLARTISGDAHAPDSIKKQYNLNPPTPGSMRDFAVKAQPPHRVHHHNFGWQGPQPQVPVAYTTSGPAWRPNVEYGAAQGFNQTIHSKAKMFALDKRA
ncbi:hypothetical protein NFJ02_03g101420 [Pycnococcus provasolii]|mmetsp:Transcript_16299/g.41521  ORF Transcript_16299/g.41521 Transcript_16299/m.41521 type:complete len:180 (+) Transcript_16299:52-591(+)